MLLSEKSSFAGRPLTLIWHQTDSWPADAKISQVSAFCVSDAGLILIIKNEHGWGLPGGHPEENETVSQALEREVWEEAGVVIKSRQLVGYVEVDDPDNKNIEGKHYLQLRFLCPIAEIKDFTADFETSERNFVKPEQLPQFISWLSASAVGRAQYQFFLTALGEFDRITIFC